MSPIAHFDTSALRAAARRAWFLFLQQLVVWTVLLAVPLQAADESPPQKPFGIDRLSPFTTSRVVGSPEEPLPYRVKRVYPNLKINFPLTVERQPASEWLVTITHETSGGPSSIVRFQDDPKVTQFETLLHVDHGVYDLTFHPDFQRNGYIYLGTNGPSRAESAAKKSGVIRYTMDRNPPYAIDPKTATTIIDWASDGHNGAALVFGNDGMLYVTSGDGTSDSDTNLAGQDMTKLLAKVLRIDVDHPAAGQNYSVPADNPFVSLAGARPETWAYGLRNPWRMAVDRRTGHIWVGNNGQDLWEQAYLVRRGDNFGWSVMEGSHPFYSERQAGPTPLVNPTVEHHHSVARSLTGGTVYYGQQFPELHGAYIYGDYSTGKIWGVKHDGKQVTWHRELADTALQITGFGADARGELLIVDYRGKEEGAFYTFELAPKDVPRPDFPTRLSQTGLFVSLRPLVPQPGLVPYSVNAALWSDGASKERYLAIPTKPRAKRPIEVTAAHGWNFPDETVLVKSFALTLDAADPASRRWIETRLLTRQEGEWVGYSYQWNEEQTEATLVPTAGADCDYLLRQPGADSSTTESTEQWHFPGRAECMVCHSRAANYVLGLSTLQMNRDHDYGGRVDNQLRTLEHLELLELAKPPAEYGRLVDPYDPAADLDARARSYLHANCAQCHVAAGGGNAQIDLDFATARDKMKLLDEPPVHHKYNLPDAKLIAPGAPERSVLVQRIAHRGPGQMPPLATSRIDEPAVRLLTEWIRDIKAP